MFERLRPGYYLLLALALAEFSLAFLFGKANLTSYFSTNGLRSMLIPIGAAFPLAWAGVAAVSITRRRVERPSAAMIRLVRHKRRWLLRGAFFAVAVLLLARSFSSYKASIPEIVPYWADPVLADLDRALFGVDPWRLTHALIGPTGTMLIDRAYALWFLMMFLCLGWFCFTRNAALQVRGLLSYLLTWATLGNLGATFFSSVGPCFYERFYGSERFTPLIDTLHRIDAESYRLIALGAMNYLTATIGKDVPAGGISAMPSLHVSIAMLFFLVCWSYSSSRLLTAIAGCYAAVIMFGSVHLGWHYALDGIVGIVVVTPIWWATGRFVDRLEAREGGLRQPQATTLRAKT